MSQTITASPDRFYEVSGAFQRSMALRTAIELDLFTAIAEGHATVDAIAQRCGIAHRGARILADYLAINGLLTKQANHYALAPDATIFLNRHSPAYIGSQVEFVQSNYVLAHFMALTDRVRQGGAPARGNEMLSPDHDLWVRFARVMGPMMGGAAQVLATHLLGALGASRPLKILDVGAGHGMHGIAFLQQSAQVRVTAQDWPAVLAVAKENAVKYGVADRFETIDGSAFETPFGSGYDVAIVANILHNFDAGANIALLCKVHAALKPGGLAVIVEFAPNDDRVTPPTQAAFALFMLATSPEGDAYTVTELESMCRAAGFVNVRMVEFPAGGERYLLATTGARGAGG